nr:DUF58 domain-containing protein [Actinomadura sp. J1-007]
MTGPATPDPHPGPDPTGGPGPTGPANAPAPPHPAQQHPQQQPTPEHPAPQHPAPHMVAPEPAGAPPPPARRNAKIAELAPERTLRRLELSVTRRLDGLLNGEHLGLIPGPGTELAEARLYQPGEDDVRHMDWAVTARTTTPHVRDIIADHELEAWALVDITPSMDFGTADRVKRELAVAALAAVGFLTVRLGDRVGAYLLHNDGLRRWPARTGKANLYRLLHTVLDTPSGDERHPHAPAPTASPPASPPCTAARPAAASASSSPTSSTPPPTPPHHPPGNGPCAASPPATRSSPSRSSTPANSTSPTSASSR